jgi:hypothetical protein
MPVEETIAEGKRIIARAKGKQRHFLGDGLCWLCLLHVPGCVCPRLSA